MSSHHPTILTGAAVGTEVPTSSSTATGTDVDGCWPEFKLTDQAARTSNPLEDMKLSLPHSPVCKKKPIFLSIGDPTIDGNFLPPPQVDEAMVSSIANHKNNGYPPSIGTLRAREAVAKYWKTNFATNAPEAAQTMIRPENIVLSIGASQAILLAFTTLANPGDNILLPSPCFSLYDTICKTHGIETRYYTLDPKKDWQCDFDSMRRAVDGRTKAILVNNPSNPCGSNFSRAHVQEVLTTAESLRLPVIFDEIYAGMVFGNEVFTSACQFDTVVPRLIIGGTAKNFVVPGWRMGWIMMIDQHGVAQRVLDGLIQLSTLLVGPNSFTQGALESFLETTQPAYFKTFYKTLEEHAKAAHDIIEQKCPGMIPSTPKGALYMMVHIDTSMFLDIHSGIEFARKLMFEENVQVVPGEVFHMPDYIRVVFTSPKERLVEAAERIHEFCERHSKH